MLFDFALKYAIGKVRESQMGLKLNGKLQLLVYADDVNLLGDNIDLRKVVLPPIQNVVGNLQAEQHSHPSLCYY
jgi:hypothetical protein